MSQPTWSLVCDLCLELWQAEQRIEELEADADAYAAYLYRCRQEWITRYEEAGSERTVKTA